MPLFEYIVATMTSHHVVATMTSDTIVALVIPFELE
jgi:hypothetical protein